jgi:hypothetical protein
VPLFIEAFRENGEEYNHVDMELKMRSMVSMMKICVARYLDGVTKWQEVGLREVSDLNNEEMKTYIDQLIIESVDYGINITLPY